MNQSGLGKKGIGTKRIKNTKIVNHFACENDLKVTRENPDEWLMSIGPCQDMPQMDRGE